MWYGYVFEYIIKSILFSSLTAYSSLEIDLYLELIQQLFAHRLEDRLEEGAPEYEGRVEVGQGVTEGRYVTEAQPARVIHLY